MCRLGDLVSNRRWLRRVPAVVVLRICRVSQHSNDKEAPKTQFAAAAIAGQSAIRPDSHQFAIPVSRGQDCRPATIGSRKSLQGTSVGAYPPSESNPTTGDAFHIGED